MSYMEVYSTWSRFFCLVRDDVSCAVVEVSAMGYGYFQDWCSVKNLIEELNNKLGCVMELDACRYLNL